MPDYAYVNNRYVPRTRAKVDLEDRGHIFGDGVYEVIAVYNGKLVDADGHYARLKRSLQQIDIAYNHIQALQITVRKLIQKNMVRTGLVYIQITRGTAARDFPYPKNVSPNLCVMTRRMTFPSADVIARGKSIITIDDNRWARPDIKSINLLAPALGKQMAKNAGTYEAWQVRDGVITEGTSTNAWIIKDGVFYTHPANQRILNGVTRCKLIDLARKNGFEVRETAFSRDDLYAADEAFLSSTTTWMMPIVMADGRQIADGKPGKRTLTLREKYADYVTSKT